MDFLQQLSDLSNQTIELYYSCSNQTQKYWLRDNQAALKIQSKFKIAFYARKQFKKQQITNFNEKNLTYFAHQVTIIQKLFRGFFVRKYIHNFYLRKQQLRALQKKNIEFKQTLNEFGKAQVMQAQQYQKQVSKAEFNTLAKNLHHLTSTRNIPGVYNSPFAFEKPKVFEKQVEDHLKEAFRKSYRWKGVTRDDMLKHNTIKTIK